ncbi:hypothetical protein E6O75_ATG01564 [Venturia nashicola]|uniref:Uncharacterized protein n=1 Tax=Venturia nashicola TaxID=86259 RepID=A0A4Z1PMG4_9PEZI|nr:hypothetical protein E6O75_ATG01564 [Venturia nashicola]
MPTFESLPRELRQHIFALAFDDAIKADLRFNRNIQKCIYDGIYTTFIDEYRSWIYYSRLAQGYHGFSHNIESSLERRTGFAPYISKTAQTLCTVYPDVAEDAKYVLDKAIDQFEKENRAGRRRRHASGKLKLMTP